MKPWHRQGLQGAMSSLPNRLSPPPRHFTQQVALPKPLPALALAWCISSHRGYGYFLLRCNTRSVMLIEKRLCREFMLRRPACPGIPSLHGLTLHNSPGHSQLSTLAASPKAKGTESP